MSPTRINRRPGRDEKKDSRTSWKWSIGLVLFIGLIPLAAAFVGELMARAMGCEIAFPQLGSCTRGIEFFESLSIWLMAMIRWAIITVPAALITLLGLVVVYTILKSGKSAALERVRTYLEDKSMSAATKIWRVYLSGEIHTDWREEIEQATQSAGLPVQFSAPVTDHAASDDCGVAILGAEPDKYWHDHKGAMVNGIRTRTLISDADIVVVRFGEKYRQWNAAFDAGIASALGKPLIVLQRPEHDHALKEVNAAALAMAREPKQVADILAYVINGVLPQV